MNAVQGDAGTGVQTDRGINNRTLRPPRIKGHWYAGWYALKTAIWPAYQ